MRLILFDLDGTLVKSAGAGRRAMERAWAEVFGQAIALEPRWTAGRTDPAIFREMGRRSGVEAEELGRRWPELVGRYLKALAEELQRRPGEVLPGVVELLEWGEKDGWALGLGTGNLEAGARLKLAPFGLNRFFPVGGFGDDGEERPALLRAAVERACRHWGDEARCVIVVGDTPLDVEAARAAGYAAVAVATGPYGVQELEAVGADAVLPQLAPWQRAAGVLEALAATVPGAGPRAAVAGGRQARFYEPPLER